MGGHVNEFRIVLESTNDVYESGKSIRGSVILDNTADIDGKRSAAAPPYYNHISVNLSGKVLFKKNPLSHYTESFCVVYIKVWKPSSNCRTLIEERHTFPFCFEIPPTAPSSLEGSWGYLRYTLTAHVWVDKISSPGLIQVPIYHAQLGYINIRQLVYLSPEDLTHDQILPFEETEESWSDRIRVSVSLPTTKYAIGKVLLPKVSTHNDGKRRIHLVASFKQEVSFIKRSGECATSSKNTIFSIESDMIAPNSAYTWEPTIAIPPITLISSNSQCSAMRVSYIFSIKAILPRSHKNIKVIIPLTLGHQPLEQSVTSCSLEAGGAMAQILDDSNKQTTASSHRTCQRQTANGIDSDTDGEHLPHTTRRGDGLLQARTNAQLSPNAPRLRVYHQSFNNHHQPGATDHTANPLQTTPVPFVNTDGSRCVGALNSHQTSTSFEAAQHRYQNPIGWLPQADNMLNLSLPHHDKPPPEYSTKSLCTKPHDLSLPSYEEAVASCQQHYIL